MELNYCDFFWVPRSFFWFANIITTAGIINSQSTVKVKTRKIIAKREFKTTEGFFTFIKIRGKCHIKTFYSRKVESGCYSLRILRTYYKEKLFLY